MAPITEQAVDDLKSLIKQLEARVVELESRLSGGSGNSAPSEGIRMILMGPPGAGAVFCPFMQEACRTKAG